MIEVLSFGEQVPCPECGFSLYFEADKLGRLVAFCDQCPRNAARVKLGLAPLTLVDDRPVPPPSKREADAFRREQLAVSLPQAVKSGELRRAYEAGDSTVVLGARYRVQPTTIRLKLLALGVAIRPRGGATPKRKVIAEVDEMARAYRDGASTATLAAKYGVSPQTVGARLRARGVALRPKGGISQRIAA